MGYGRGRKYSRLNPWYAVARAVRRGELVKRPCEVCGASDVEAHHPDYSKPLQVVWLCHAHHAAADRWKHGLG